MKNILMMHTHFAFLISVGFMLSANGAAIAQIQLQSPLAGEQVAQAEAKTVAVAPKKRALSGTPRSAEPTERTGPVDIGPPMTLTVGKSTLLRLPQAIERISIGNPSITDVTLISARELYLIGKTFGSTNVMLWHQGGGTTVLDVVVQIDTGTLQEQLHRLLPSEKRIEVRSAADSLVLTGRVSSAVKALEAVEIAEGFVRSYSRGLTIAQASNTLADAQGPRQFAGAPQVAVGARPPSAAPSAAIASGQPKVINLLKIDQPMQVMIDVKVAEVSRTLLDKLGVSVKASKVNGDWTWSLLSNLASASPSSIGDTRIDGKGVTFDAQKQDGVI
jgi:pilus assembly protein CpaC